MKQSTSFAQVATNLLNVLQGYTKGIRFVAVLTMLLIVGIGQVWGQTTTTYTFSSKSWAASPANWTSGKDGNQMQSGRGIQVTTGATGANATSPKSFTNVSKIVVTYSTNASAGAGTIKIKIGSNTEVSQDVTKTGGTTDRTLTYNFSPNQTGSVKVTVTCSTNSIYLKSIAITEAAATVNHTVTWNVNGEVYETTKVTEGSKPIFPATPSSCDATSNTFYGWATATWDGKIDDINGKTIYTSANEMPAVNGAVPYYAVFAETTTTGGGIEEKDFSFNITKADFNTTSYAANNNEKTSIATASDASTMEIKWTSNQVMQQSSVMQWQKDKGYIFNSTDLGTIKSIEISKTDGTFTTYYGTSKQPTSGTTVGNGYFQIKVGNATGKVSNIKVTFTQTVEGETTTTSSDYITTCTTETSQLATPTGLNVTNITSTSATLSWGEVANASSYTVFITDLDDEEITLTDIEEASVDVTGLSPETLYLWDVVAIGDGTNYTDSEHSSQTDPNAEFTTLNACEKLGAATGLTVETDFVQDGQTYVKFSWTPANNTKNYAASQKLCFGKVGEAGTCVDDLANNITWTGDLASKLSAGEYWWSIQALGDGINYCDGDVVKGTNFYIYSITYNTNGGNTIAATSGTTLPDPLPTPTREHYNFEGWYTDQGLTQKATAGAQITQNTTLYAKWTANTYTITLDAGTGECGTESFTTTNASGVTLPTASHTCTDWTFAGWWTEEVSSTNTSPGTLLNAGDTYNPTSDITLYAVYSTQEAGDAFTGYAKVTTAPDDWSGKYLLSTGTYTATGAYDASGANGHLVRTTYTPGTDENAEWEFTLAKVDVDGNTVGYSILFPDGSFYLGYASSTNFQRSIDDPSENEAYLWTPSISGITNVGDNTRIIKDGGSDFRPYVNDNPIVYLYKRVGGGSTTIYNSNPTCLVPVWEGATIDNTNLTVNCGERSPMTGANGAAKITFPTEKIYNFTKDITIEATTGFLVSTSQTEDANYKSLVSLSPLVGTANANTFYNKFVYVRAEAPAMSEEDLSGTITIKNNKGETLQTFSVTADVTCAQYTLTLVDRGVSTEQPTKYYAGETIDEAPANPEGVCTDPIHYVFDGWAETTVTNGSTGYTPVSFPYTVTGNTKFYAVYRYLEGGGNGDYNLVTEKLADWSGDYLIAYSDQIFANGTIGGESGIGAKNNKVDLSSYISGSTIPATEGDKYKVTLEAVTGGYVLKTQDGKYNYHTNNTGNGISASTIGYADDYPISVDFVSQEEINLCLGGNAKGSVFRYNTDGYFRFYKNGGLQPVYLYKKSTGTTLYTSAPVCGPLVEITSDKDIYVTGGNAGGTRSLVVAQKKITFSATRLQPNAGGNAPSIKVPAADITIDGNPTTKVALSITQDLTEQGDGTYAGTGEITISYTPTAFNVNEDINVQLRAEYNTGSDVILDAFTVHARSLPQEFVIVAKQGEKWYALNGDMSNGSSANPANGQVVLDDDTEPTKATYAPCNTIYTFDGLPNTGDRKYVRFQGTDGAWLWASSGTNVGVQNKTLAQTPTGDNKPYNWKLETEDNITYKFHNDNSSRLLGLSGEKFGMYASAVQEFRILPYDVKCLYNYAPTNLKVSVLKGSYVTLTWDAVAGATKYQYSTDATNWNDAGTEPTATITGLTGDKEYTYYIRAYHEDAGVSHECIDYAEITFTTANCDDVPTDITYTADLNSITVSWTAAASTATITYNTKEDGTGGGGTINDATSPYKISGGLDKNTTYYIQILADGTCASPIIPVKTEDVEVDIVEWDPQGIIVDINTDETIGVTLENEVSYGSGIGTEATELFFSKYYEASYNVKLVAIYNGTKNIINLTDYTIQYGKTSWETNYITLKDFGATKGQIQPGEEIILYSYTENNADDKKILDCVHDAYPDGNWVRVTSTNNDGKGTLSFGGDKTIILCKTEYDDEAGEYYDNIIDVIGALIEDPNVGILPTNENTEKPSWGDKEGWVCETGLSIADDSQIGISTNRCLLVRNNTVTSGLDAVAQNIEGDFVTLCSEWKGAQVPDSDIDNGVAASCENFAYVGTFDYSDYYTKYVSMGEGTTFEENDRNPDGTVTIPITDLYKHACSNIRVKLSNKDGEVLSDREYKVPIMITSTQGTNGQTFLDLQQNLATKEVDGDGNVIATYPLSLEEVREICKTCDVVVRDNATLTKVTDGTTNDHPEVHDIYVYENSSLIVPNGTNYTINNLSLRRKQDAVASVSAYPDALKLPESAAAPISLDFRLSAESWHWFTLPFDCNISEVTWIDGSTAQYNVDWFLMTYDGEKRAATQAGGCWKAYTGTTIKAGEGFILAINGNINNPKHTYELRFPMSKEVLAAEGTDKTVAVRAWGVETNIRPNHKGWNLVGNPYLAYYQRNNITNFEGLRLGQLTGPDPQTGYWEQTGDVPYVVVPVGAGWIAYEQVLASETDLLPFTAYFVQVGNDGTHNSTQDLKVAFDHTKLQLSATPMPASIIQRSATEASEPVIVGVSLTNAKGESDKTSLIIDNQYTNEYEMHADFFKWFGDYYKYYTKPVLYTVGADQGKRAFNAISEDLATQPISLGMYAAQAGNYTFSLDLRSDLSKVQEVWLYDAIQDTYTNLLQDSYTFQTAKTESAGRFFLSVKMAPKVSTDINNVTDGTIWATTQDHTIFVNGLLSNAQLWIYDATGKLLHTDQTQYFQHSYSVPISGTYFVRLQNTMQTQTIKVVVE